MSQSERGRRARSAFFSELLADAKPVRRPAAGAAGGEARAEAGELFAQLAKALPTERRELVMRYVRGEAAKVLGLESGAKLDAGKGLMEMGMDSLMAVEFRNRLKKGLGEAGKLLSATLVFNHPTIDALASYLLKDVLKADQLAGPSTAPGAAKPAAAPKAPAPKPGAAAADDPIVLVGMACRFPGPARDLGAFWKLISEGRDAITDVPKERWDIDAYYDADPDAPGKLATRRGAFVENVDQFDPEFFGIRPVEAAAVDPQQRLTLEVAWEALEHAGIAPGSLAQSDTGVYFGVSLHDYALLEYQNQDKLNAFSGTGTNESAVSGRLSYLLDLKGPSITLNTACSSALVAVHLAAQSLQAGETDLALAGGVNLILTPDAGIAFSRAHMLAPDGVCKTFDDSADGYGRGEGCGVLVLERLSDARARGHRVLAVVRASSVNQDGASTVLTAPNGLSQEAVIRGALRRGGVRPHEVGYVEAHGTGTPLGDPIEVQSISNVLREGRDAARPLYLGTVKSNIGHTESAAGVAGVIKAALALMHDRIPPQIHFNKINSKIVLEDIPAVIPRELTKFPVIDGRRVAGVSSFGFTGTNAHLLLEGAEAVAASAPRRDGGTERPQHLLPLSARTDAALRELCARYARRLGEEPAPAVGDLCFTAGAGRAHFRERLAVTGASAAELRARLEDVIAGRRPPGATRARAEAEAPKVAFLFSGQGSQYPGMGRELYASQPEFRRALDECAGHLQGVLERPLLDVMLDRGGAGELLKQTQYTQPALFALEYALARLWLAWGIHPAAMMGHSVGEYVAACVAGVFSLPDGLKLISQRGALMAKLPGRGEMASVNLAEAKVRAAIREYSAKLSIAAVNGPESTVAAGDAAALREALAPLERAGAKVKFLAVSHGFHSPQMDPMLAEFERVARAVTYAPPQIRLVSNLTGRRVEGAEVCDPMYWVKHVREAVRFDDGMRALWDEGFRSFLEVGPGTTLLGMGRHCRSEAEAVAAGWWPTLKKDRADWEQLLETLGALYASGQAPDWAGLEAHCPARARIDLPSYPFQRSRFWIESASNRPRGSAAEPAEAEDSGLYEIQWQPEAAADTGAEPVGSWLVLADEGGVGAALARRLAETGRTAFVARPGAAFAQDGNHFTLPPGDAAAHRALLGAVAARGPLARVVHLWSMDSDELERAQEIGCRSALALVQAMAATRGAGARLALVTRGAVLARPADGRALAFAHAPLWGFGRVIPYEHPEFAAVRVDLDAAAGGADLLRVLETAGTEDQIALREGQRYVARLVPLPKPAPVSGLRKVRADATYLITGGYGGLGLHTARWLVESGARHLALMGRKAPPDEARGRIRELEAAGARIELLAADVADAADTGRALARVRAAMPPLRGIFHAAGLLDEALITEQSWPRFASLMAPKLRGTWNLHHLTRDLELDFFVAYSSVSAILGSPNLSSYCAANAFQDAFAQYRAGQGLAALSVDWGPWEGEGMFAAVSERHRKRLLDLGFEPIPPRKGMEILGQILHSQGMPSQIGVML